MAIIGLILVLVMQKPSGLALIFSGSASLILILTVLIRHTVHIVVGMVTPSAVWYN